HPRQHETERSRPTASGAEPWRGWWVFGANSRRRNPPQADSGGHLRRRPAARAAAPQIAPQTIKQRHAPMFTPPRTRTEPPAASEAEPWRARWVFGANSRRRNPPQADSGGHLRRRPATRARSEEHTSE